MAELSDHRRITDSQKALYVYVQGQTFDLGSCPACGSVFLLHICHANPVKGKGVKEAKPRPVQWQDEIHDWMEEL